jgi:hypothetical protein
MRVTGALGQIDAAAKPSPFELLTQRRRAPFGGVIVGSSA